MKQCLKQNPGLAALIGIALLVMAGAAIVDREWTLALSRLDFPKMVDFMQFSIFEGEPLGANDLVILFMLAVIAAYYAGWRLPETNPFARWRPQSGFAVVSALVAAIYLVHGLKWIMGRARPDLVLQQTAAFSPWFAFGPFFVTDGIFYGSFPSGHTAQAFILMAVAYALAGDPLVAKPVRIAGWLWGVLTMVFSLAMGASRCMTLSHWLSDILGSICISWICMHMFYFNILRVPDQRRYLDRHGCMPALPQVWEVILCLYLLLATIGAMAVIIGLRAVWIGKGPWLVAMVPIGVVFGWIAWRKSVTLLRNVWQTLAIGAVNP